LPLALKIEFRGLAGLTLVGFLEVVRLRDGLTMGLMRLRKGSGSTTLIKSGNYFCFVTDYSIYRG
jgi:hypothetical protein